MVEVTFIEHGGTVHALRVEAGWVSKLDSPGPDETSLLEFVLEPRPESRLSCQIRLTDALSGIVLRLPESQT